MNESGQIDYASASTAVRDDITDAHRQAWQRIANPGTWWTGKERVGIAAEARYAVECSLCKERKAALSPNTVEGTHESLGSLDEGVVDVIHRLVTDPGRLSQAWYKQVLAEGIEDAHYVEIIGVVITVVTVDVFCRGVGVPKHPLPSPVDGDPLRHRPESAKMEAAWVPMITQGEETGLEADLYQEGGHGNVGRALSLVPNELRGMKSLIAAQYVPMHQVGDVGLKHTISRTQMELIAGRVSALNGCFY